MRHLVRAPLRASRFPLLKSTRSRSLILHQRRAVSAWTAAGDRGVKLRQPWINWRTVALWTFYSATSYLAIEYLAGRIVDGLELDDDDEQEAAADEEAEEEGDEEGTVVLSLEDDQGSFVPLQTPKQLPRQFYKHSDPEWQEFVKLSNDADRQEEARRDLAEKLVKTASMHKLLQQKLGKDIKWSQSWLDFTYPEKAAPEYIRRGWVLLEDGALWSQQIMPHSQYIQLRHILWPTALYRAGKACLRTFYDLQVIRIKNALGVDLDAKEKQLQLATKVVVMQRNAQLKMLQAKQQLDQAKVEVDKKSELQQSIQKQHTEEVGSTGSKEGQRSPGGTGKPWQITIKVPLPILSSDFLIATRMFVGSFAQAWKQSKLDTMPPGCCYLTGDIELVGSQARCKMKVKAAYDPKANTFVWINSKAEGFWNHSQTAKGGP